MCLEFGIVEFIKGTLAKALWNKLGTLYQANYLVNKLFLQKMLYNLRMKDGDSLTKHMNAFNIVVGQLLSVDIKISDEDRCIRLLCSLQDSWAVWLSQYVSMQLRCDLMK